MLAAELKTADEVASWLGDIGSNAVEVFGYTDEDSAARVQISLGSATCSLMLPLTGADVLWSYYWLASGREG